MLTFFVFLLFCFLALLISRTLRPPAVIVSVALPQFVPAPKEFCCSPLGGDMTICFHLLTNLQLQVYSTCCSSYTLLRLWIAAPSHGLLPPPPPPLHPSSHPTITPSRTSTLLKSAAIKTDAGLKCHKHISNCQNINLLTLPCFIHSFFFFFF